MYEVGEGIFSLKADKNLNLEIVTVGEYGVKAKDGISK